MALLLAAASVPLLPAQASQGGNQLLIAPIRADFGSQQIDSASQPVSIIIKNTTPRAISLVEIIASGIDFSVQNSCEQQLPPNAECTLQVRFRPAVTGTRSGILEIVTSSSSAPYFVPLSGTGVSSVSPEGSGTGGSLSPFDGHENLAPKEKR